MVCYQIVTFHKPTWIHHKCDNEPLTEANIYYAEEGKDTYSYIRILDRGVDIAGHEGINMAEWDLTSVMGQYLDRHLVFPLLEFLSETQIYDAADMMQGKLDLLSKTNMVDFAKEVYERLHPDSEVPEFLTTKREDVVHELRCLSQETEPIVKIMDMPEVAKHIEQSKDGRQLFDTLAKEFNFTTDQLQTLYKYARFQYDCGNYTVAAEYLYFVRVLTPNDDHLAYNALWGKLAAEILMQNWDAALEDLNKLKDVIDSSPFSSDLQSLQQRTWFIHWSLFVFFNHPKGGDLIIDMFLVDNKHDNNYINDKQSISVSEYYSDSVSSYPEISNYSCYYQQEKKDSSQRLVRVIQQETYTYRDPITEFLECLYVNFDFDRAQQQLRDCETVLSNDFFLVACLDDFIENARLFIFETFCRIHQCISISMLADKLNMSPEDAERWIVNLIRNARLDAKIDSQLGHVVMGTQAVSVYQQVIEKTKGLSFRSQMLALNIDKKFGNRDKDNWGAQDF
ncbi:EIF3E [Bugula neritina]|uniref:Eukaryotic translation initiation factor 3 subunit E n=1 Tax=Bugula neritina TaxID=10212 RepID=A0A7J7IU21_BUGNE|nr:EIF3E [Bugula neritina]